MNECFSPNMDPARVREISSLGLAHVGDAVYELLVRTWLCTHGRHTNKGMHRETVALVRAAAQARAAARLQGELTPEEQEVYRRGRNTQVHSVPKGADIADYHAATGLEALFGWLYLTGQGERLETLFRLALEEVRGNAS